MLKNFCFAMVAVALLCAGARASDDVLSGGKIDLGSIRDADNTVVEPNFAVDVDSLAKKTSDKNDEAVEVCCRGYGGCGYSCCYRSRCCYSSCYYPSYNCCYSSCYYPSYSCCYYPSYSCCYPTYSCCYQPTYYSCCCPLYNWGCY
jgi:hypothetical protein